MLRREKPRPKRSVSVSARRSRTAAPYSARRAPCCSRSTMTRPTCQYVVVITEFTDRAAAARPASIRGTTSATSALCTALTRVSDFRTTTPETSRPPRQARDRCPLRCGLLLCLPAAGSSPPRRTMKTRRERKHPRIAVSPGRARRDRGARRGAPRTPRRCRLRARTRRSASRAGRRTKPRRRRTRTCDPAVNRGRWLRQKAERCPPCARCPRDRRGQRLGKAHRESRFGARPKSAPVVAVAMSEERNFASAST